MKQSIASDVVKLTLSKTITMIISIITVMLLSRFLTLEEYGTYSQLLLVVNLITTIFMIGLPNSINFFLVRMEGEKDKQKFLSVYYTLSTILSFITGLVLIISTPLIIDYFDNPFIGNFMYVLAIFPWAKIILSSLDNILIVYKKTTFLLFFRIMNSVSLLLIILFVKVFNLSFSIYMFLFIIVEIFYSLWVYFIAQGISNKLKIIIDKSLLTQILRFSLPIGLASVIGLLSIELDKLIIGAFYNTEHLAIYTNAAREMPVTIVATSLTAILMPHLVHLLKKNKNNDAIRMWGYAISLSYTVICFFIIVLIVYSTEVITIMYSEKYLPGITVFRIYTIILILRITYFGMILNSIGKTKFILYSSIMSLALNVVLSYTFYYIFGFIGPAIATLISIAVIQIIQLIATSKIINIPFRRIFPWKELSGITIINIILGIMFVVIKRIFSIEVINSEIIESMIFGFLWVILYVLIMGKFIKEKWKLLSEYN
ncbi:oligosaccharide flippase family protein [Pseudalkalibacillus sp. R45]|uniref:oligosaccharide flippase family protein n=1 Tax=Pseudalkalibacillus sp. R45 TaxID=3457433 RepID=UPI003FCCD628